MEQIKLFNLIKSSKALSLLKADIKSATVSHAYVFLSPDQSMLLLLAKAFISQIIGGGEDSIDSRLKQTRVFDGSYLDIIQLPRLGTKENDKKFKTSDSDFIAETCYMTPSELEHKYYIINPAEPIAEIAQNKLLKTLEEPPACARFIILAKSENELLPTVLSRCRIVRLEEFSQNSIADELRRYYADEKAIMLAAASCNGRAGLADYIMSQPKYLQVYECAFNVLKFMLHSSEVLRFASKLSELADLNSFFNYIEIILRDVMVYKSGKPELMNMQNNTFDILELSKQYSIDCILSLMPLIGKARLRIKGNGNANSIIDEFLFSILEVKAKCRK